MIRAYINATTKAVTRAVLPGSGLNHPPINLSVTEILGGYTLTWDAEPYRNVEIWKAIDAYDYTLLATASVGDSTYTDTTATHGITKYKIRAKSGEGYSQYTTPITKTSPYNLVKGEGGLTPSFLTWPFSYKTDNLTPTLEDNTDGPFQTTYLKKRRLTSTGTGTTIHTVNVYLPQINPTIMSFGFWVNDSDIASIYGTTGPTSLMNMWLYKAAVVHDLNFTVRTIIATVGNHEEGTFAKAGYASGSYKVVCLAKSDGYSYIAITWHTITWEIASGINYFTLYMIYNSVATAFNGKKIDYIGFTWHYNYEIISANPAPDTSVTLGNLFVNRQVAGSEDYMIVRFPYSATNDLLLFTTPYKDLSYSNNTTVFDRTHLISIASSEIYQSLVSSTLIHNTSGDHAPIKLASTYIGGDHGSSNVVKVTKVSHGKTVMDVGSEWLDGAGNKFYIIRILDADNIWFLSENIGTGNIWSFRTMAAGTITHSANATNTDSITSPTISNSNQLLPSIKNHTRSVTVNGNVVVTPDMMVKGSYIDIDETYDIVNPASALESIKSSVGSGVQPPLNDGNSAFTVAINYRILSDGTNIITTTFTFNQEAALDYIGFIQSNKMNVIATLTKVKMFVPKSLSIGGYDFNKVADFTANPAGVLDFTSEYWADANSPVDRVTQFLALADDSRQHAFSMGYIPNYGVMVNRKDLVTNAWSFFTSGKSYPHAVDSKVTPITTGTIYQSKAFRKYFDVSTMPVGRVSNYFVEDGTDTYLYVEYNGIISDTISIPVAYQGKTITLIEKSANVTYIDTITGATLAVEVVDATPLTGWLVIKLT